MTRFVQEQRDHKQPGMQNYRETHRHTARQTHSQTYRQTDRQKAVRQTIRQTYRQTHRQTDRQIETKLTHTYKPTELITKFGNQMLAELLSHDTILFTKYLLL